MKKIRDPHNRTDAAKPASVIRKGRFAGFSFSRFPELIDLLLLYALSRGVLTVIGVLAYTQIGKSMVGRAKWVYSPHCWLDIWGQWDTGWYLNITKDWYSAGQPYGSYANYAFFPLYPSLMKLLGYLIGDNFIAGLIISNAALLGAAFLLYQLVLLDHERDVALNSVKYLFLWPTSFVLSGVLSEGLFLLLLLACFYLMRKNAWLEAGVAGFFLSLTRVIGVCFSLPLLYEYLKARGFSLRAIRPDILALALVPAGLLVFSIYNHYLTGDYLAFFHIQSSAWGRHPGNPLTLLFRGMAGIQTNLNDVVSAWFTGFALFALIRHYRKIPFSHWLFCMLSICIPLSSGLASMPRFLSVLFPLFILFAQWGRNKRADLALTVIFAVLQGCLMAFWSIGSTLII